MRRLIDALAVYAEPRVLAVLFLGFSSGLPLALTGQTLQVWMREFGVSIATIGLFGLVGLPYVLKFLWAPAIDAVRIPLLTRRLGRRRAWLVTTQLALMAAVAGLGSNDPAAHPALTAALALLVSVCSASQDIVIDAFRIESLDDSRAGAGMANYVAGYRIAVLVATAGAFEIADRLQHAGLPGAAGWSATYVIMAALGLVGIAAALASPEPAAPGDASATVAGLARRLKGVVIDPFLDFIGRPGWLAIISFVLLYKFGDALVGQMTAPFVLDLGFDKVTYGRIVKLFGFGATLIGGFAGGAVQRWLGVVRALWIAGIAHASANLLFIWLAHQGNDVPALMLTITVENFTVGLGSVVFVAYISGLCENRAYTATQFALLSALAAFARVILAAPAGYVVETVGWTGFYLFAGACALPGLVLLYALTRRGGLTAAARKAA